MPEPTPADPPAPPPVPGWPVAAAGVVRGVRSRRQHRGLDGSTVDGRDEIERHLPQVSQTTDGDVRRDRARHTLALI
jgi:hypothetical protein